MTFTLRSAEVHLAVISSFLLLINWTGICDLNCCHGIELFCITEDLLFNREQSLSLI